MNLNFLSYSRLFRQLLHFKSRHPGLEVSSNVIVTPIDKHGRTPLDYILCVVEAFKRTKKWSSYNRRIILQNKPPRSLTRTGKMEQGWTSLSDKVLMVVGWDPSAH